MNDQNIKPLPEIIKVDDGRVHHRKARLEDIIKNNIIFVPSGTKGTLIEAMALMRLYHIESKNKDLGMKRNNNFFEEDDEDQSKTLLDRLRSKKFIKENGFGFIDEISFKKYSLSIRNLIKKIEDPLKEFKRRTPILLSHADIKSERANYFGELPDGSRVVAKIYIAPYKKVIKKSNKQGTYYEIEYNSGDIIRERDPKHYNNFTVVGRERSQATILYSFNKQNIDILVNKLKDWNLSEEDATELYIKNKNLKETIKKHLLKVLTITKENYDRYATKSRYKDYLNIIGFSEEVASKLLKVQSGESSIDDMISDFDDDYFFFTNFFKKSFDFKVMPIIDFIEDKTDSLLYLLFPEIDAPTLDKANLSLEESLKVISSVSKTISISHNEDILHGDIKPENILYLGDGECLLFDWDNAVNMRIPFYAEKFNAICVATPHYASPEVLGIAFNKNGDYSGLSGDRALDKKSDVYSLATTLYYLVLGKPPFTVVDDEITKKMHENEKQIHRLTITYNLKLDNIFLFSPSTIFSSLYDFLKKTTGTYKELDNYYQYSDDDEDLYSFILGEYNLKEHNSKKQIIKDYAILYFAFKERGVFNYNKNNSFNDLSSKIDNLILDYESSLIFKNDENNKKHTEKEKPWFTYLTQDTIQYANDLKPLFDVYAKLYALFEASFNPDPEKRIDLEGFKMRLNDIIDYVSKNEIKINFSSFMK